MTSDLKCIKLFSFDIKFPKTIEDIARFFGNFSRKYFKEMSYIMLQPCLANKKEYKGNSYSFYNSVDFNRNISTSLQRQGTDVLQKP